MTQQINFLKSVPKSTLFLPASWIALGGILLIGFLTTITIFRSTYIYYQSQQLKSLEKESAAALLAFQKVAKAYPLFASDTPLVTQVTNYENLLREKQAHFVEISHTTLRQPFSLYMQTLSEKVPNGLWLTSISIDEDKNQMSISGYAMEPISVSIFLQALQSSHGFGNVNFDLFYLKQVPDKNYFRFEIANEELKTLEQEIKKAKLKEEELKKDLKK